MSSPSDFSRGERQGEVASQLAEHERHLDKLAASIDRLDSRLANVATVLNNLLQAVARIDQAMVADKDTVAATAAALRNQADAAGTADATRWTPFNRLLVSLSTIAAIAGAVYVVIHG
jgi:septal ring factor EnvC (AmiA/AmiB activator)